MRIFVAGATGVIGSRLVPALIAAGHQVVGTTRWADRAARLRAVGAEPVVVDPLDRDAVTAVVLNARPTVVMHQLTALTGVVRRLRNFDREFAATNRLRTVGLDNLLAAAIAAGAERFIAQSYAGWPYAQTGGPVKTEADPLTREPPAPARQSLAAIRHLETQVTGPTGLTGVVLRYGALYGPGTGLEHGGPMLELLRRRRLPIVGDGGGVWSFLHVEDAVGATVAAVDRGPAGIYNVTDDEPAPVARWLPYLAERIGAPPPRRVPRWLALPWLGRQGVAMMTTARGADNHRARSELDWHLTFPTWREGFRTGLG